jgi:hypothetical protein
VGPASTFTLSSLVRRLLTAAHQEAGIQRGEVAAEDGAERAGVLKHPANHSVVSTPFQAPRTGRTAVHREINHIVFVN